MPGLGRTSLEETADTVVGMALSRPPTLPGGRLVCIDGPAGSGKTTLGEAVRRRALEVGADDATLGSVLLLHMDDMYPGWSGLGDVTHRISAGLIGPLSTGRPAGYQRYDWAQDRFAEWCPVGPAALTILEGVASGARAYAEAITVLVWVEAPAVLRLERGLARDGAAMRPQWERWMRQEQDVFRRGDTRARADLVVDSVTG